MNKKTDVKPEPKKDPSQKKEYVKPKFMRVPLAKGGMIEYSKPYSCGKIIYKNTTNSNNEDNGITKAVDLPG